MDKQMQELIGSMHRAILALTDRCDMLQESNKVLLDIVSSNTVSIEILKVQALAQKFVYRAILDYFKEEDLLKKENSKSDIEKMLQDIEKDNFDMFGGIDGMS